jgi:hypothetical protein
VLLLVVWIVVVVLAVVVLAVITYGVLGARARLAREVTAFDREVRPVLEQFQQAADRRTGDG